MDWKYTKIKNLKLEDYVSSSKAPTRPGHDDFKKLAALVTGETYNLVILNGEIDTTLSSLDSFPQILKFKKTQKKFTDPHADRFTESINSDGISIEISLEEETSLDRPLKIIFYQSQSVEGKALLIQPKIFVHLGKRSKMQLIAESVGAAGHDYFMNARMHFQISESANFEFVQITNDSALSHQLWRYTYFVGKNAAIRTLLTVLEAGRSRTEVYIPVSDENISNQFFALGNLRGKSQFDLQSLIDHQKGHSNTVQICKILADDESRGSFGGKILIARDAQKTLIEQLNQNILLSNKAEIDSEPQLEIDADDVKASHGSTTGGLDPQEIFYLQSRAIPKAEALKMLSFGFMNELVQRLENDVMRSQTENRLRAHLNEIESMKSGVLQ